LEVIDVPATSERLEKLQKMLEREPNDTFLLYGVALEYKKLDDADNAIKFLNRVIELDPGYCYAYHQKGLTYESLGDSESAKQAYRAGIAAAQKKGDAHAAGEIEAALSMIES
jgi:tetratricopeptide (TPR) repeat protein